MNQNQQIFTYLFIVLICLTLVVFGISVDVRIENPDDPLSVAQSMSIFALAFLSIGLFLQNHASKMEKKRGYSFSKFLRIVCFAFFIVFLIIIFLISQGKTITPFYMALLAIALFFGNLIMNSDFKSEELEVTKKITQFSHTPSGRLFWFIFILAFIGICISLAAVLFGYK